MPLFAHCFACASILSAHNRGSVERKYWWASEILSNPNHLAAGHVHADTGCRLSEPAFKLRKGWSQSMCEDEAIQQE